MSQKQIKTREFEFKSLPWKELKTYDFNSLKESQNRDINKLKNAIVNSKFSFPFYVWNRYVLDGKGRNIALLELEADGYKIPDLPCVFIHAENIQEAKHLVLMASSQHGQITQESFDLFIKDIDLKIEEIEIPLINIQEENQDDDKKKEINYLNKERKKILQIIINCTDEKEQEENFNKLLKLGFDCKIINI